MKFIKIQTVRDKIDNLLDTPYPPHDQQCDWEDGVTCGLCMVDNFLEKVKEDNDAINLKEEIEKYLLSMSDNEHRNIADTTFRKIASHFFELGLNASNNLK